MMREFEIEALIAALEHAELHAKAAGLDAHYLAEINHLIVTAKHNREEDGQCA